MKRLTIRALSMRSFKGAAERGLYPNGANTSIYGDNGSGKTTLHDAWSWLLFGKDSAGSADFAIKTVDADGVTASGVDHQVTAEVDLGDGSLLELKKIYAEKWTKRRGSTDAELTGHETKHYLDGVPTSKREYDAAVAEIAPADTFRTLSDPLHFSGALDWKARRDALVEAFGNVDAVDLVAAHPDLQRLEVARGKHTVDAFRKILDERRKGLNRDRSALPARIDEVNRTLAGAPEVKPANAEVEAAETAVGVARRALLDATEDSGAAKSRAARASLKAELAEINADTGRAHEARRREIGTVHADASGAAYEAGTVLARMERAQQQQHEMEREVSGTVDRARAAYQAARVETFDAPEVEGVCPGCGRPMPEHKVLEARAAAEAAWRANLAERLEQLVERGKTARARLSEIRAEADQIAAKLLKAQTDRAAAEQALEVASAALAELQAGPEPTEAANQRASQIAVKLAEPEVVDQEPAAEREALEAAEQRAALARQALAAARAATSGRQRIEELKADEKRLGAELTATEQLLALADAYTRYKVGAMEDAINQHFGLARFRLFAEQINGGIAEICDTTYHGVPWASLNHGAKINVGLDIIDTLAQHHGFAPPVWIDNAESITSINPTVGQQIRLVVSPDDRTLRTEVETPA